MLLEFQRITKEYLRPSKLGKIVKYLRTSVVCVFRCDNCGIVFERAQSKIAPKRRSNTYFHVCGDCDNKRFAQHKGAERRTIWDRPVSSSDDISRL